MVEVAERLSPIGNKFADNPVVFPATGIGAMSAEVVHIPGNSDVSLPRCLVKAVFWELFSFVGH